jgi:hypothetical protein
MMKGLRVEAWKRESRVVNRYIASDIAGQASNLVSIIWPDSGR